MGICASCLGLERHPSHDVDETDALLDDENEGYGAADAGDGAQVDEEELRREREALERITNAATENMIDVSQAETFGHSGDEDAGVGYGEVDGRLDEEEAAWWASVRGEDVDGVQGMREDGGLGVDEGELGGKRGMIGG